MTKEIDEYHLREGFEGPGKAKYQLLPLVDIAVLIFLLLEVDGSSEVCMIEAVAALAVDEELIHIGRLIRVV